MKRMVSSLGLIAFVFGLNFTNLLTMASGQAEANKKAKQDPKPKKDDFLEAAAIEELVAQLDHPQVAKQEEAKRKLLKAGKSAVPDLSMAALSDKKDLIEKSITLIKKLCESEDKATQEAARGTLKMLSKCNRPLTAQRAMVALNELGPDVFNPFDGWDKGLNPFAMNQANGGSNRSVSISSNNGKRMINVKEGNTETKIEDLDGGTISVRINGGEKKVDLKVKNLEDLKAKSPDAYALYMQYGGPSRRDGAFGNGLNFKNVGKDKNINKEMVKQLEQLKEQFKGNDIMRQIINEQIKMYNDR